MQDAAVSIKPEFMIVSNFSLNLAKSLEGEKKLFIEDMIFRTMLETFSELLGSEPNLSMTIFG